MIRTNQGLNDSLFSNIETIIKLKKNRQIKLNIIKRVTSLTRMCPLVSLKMRTLGINLFASRKLAFVYPAFRVGWAVLVAPCVMPVGYRAR